MNIAYLDFLPEVENTYNIKLDEDEKVVYTTNLYMMGTEKGMLLGKDCEFTLTNKKFFIYNGAGYWTIDIAKDIVKGEKVKSGFFIKQVYFAITLKETILYHYGTEKLSGYRFYYEDDLKFEEVMSNLFM